MNNTYQNHHKKQLLLAAYREELHTKYTATYTYRSLVNLFNYNL
jgi:hypothetical protein